MKITAIFATYSNVGLYQSSLSELELLDLVVRLAFHGSLKPGMSCYFICS